MGFVTIRTRSFLLLALAAIILGIAHAGVGVATEQASDAKPQLRVLTYNIHHGEAMDGKFDYQRLSKVIADLKPDVVGLQEVDFKTQRSGGVDQAEILGKLTRMQHVFGQAMPFQDGGYGEAVLSRFPIEKVETYPLPYRPGQEPRAALSIRIKPGNGLPELIFVNTHLCHQSSETRIWQAQQINQVFPKKSGPPIILVGDLNARVGSETMKELLAERWVDTVSPQSRIDYVLTRKGDPWRVVEVKIVEELIVSDHNPVLVVLEWMGEIIDN
ncbi:MAG: endonuclease/exonuclease/phosphatase family protein [Anaerolineales bacterium]